MILVDRLRNLYRGPRPANLAALRSDGVKRIINLESGIYSMLHPGDVIERQFPCEFGMKEYNMPCSDLTPPEAWVVETVIRLMADSLPTYVHCLSGVDRTGYVCAAYRMRVQQWPYAAAVKEWKDLGRHPWYFWWGQRLKHFKGVADGNG